LTEWAVASYDADRVIALIAPGGTGKTALAERIISAIPKQASAGLLVWSFYTNPKTEAFLRAACEYILGEAPKETGALIERLRKGLTDGAPHLFILDGLELIQANGLTGRVRGEFENEPQIKLFLRWLAAGHETKARALITSRFPLPDLEDWKQNGYREELLDDLDNAAATALLRKRGVRGDQKTLTTLAESVHRHALTVDVLGAYLATYCDGDPAQAPSFDPELLSDTDVKTAKLHRVLAGYAQRLSPQERDLLIRLSMFSSGVMVHTLLCLVEAGGVVAGALVGCKARDLSRLLQRLRLLGLVFRFQLNRGEAFTAHPFVRGFFSRLTPPPPHVVFEAVRTKLASRLKTHLPTNRWIPNFIHRNEESAARTQEYVRDPHELDSYEELVEYTRLTGKIRESMDLFSSEFGCFDHLGHVLGEHSRGVRILSGFIPDGNLKEFALGLPDKDRILYLANLGMHASVLGDLKTAESSFQCALQLCRDGGNHANASLILQNLCGTHLLLGYYSFVAKYAAEARTEANLIIKGRSNTIAQMSAASHVYLAHAMAQMGRLAAADAAFTKVARLESNSPNAGRGLWESEFCHNKGETEKAIRESQQYLKAGEIRKWGRLVALCEANLARFLIASDINGAKSNLRSARAFGAKSGELNVLLRCYHAAAEIARHERDFPLAISVYVRFENWLLVCKAGSPPKAPAASSFNNSAELIAKLLQSLPTVSSNGLAGICREIACFFCNSGSLAKSICV
jgi:tetratricopeptide (TPR) repeat protein